MFYKQKIIYDNDYVKHFHVIYISQTEFIQRRKKVSNKWCHKHSTICVLYRYIYTTSKIFGHFHPSTSLACTCTHRKILFPVIAKRVSNILRTETALRFWRKKLGECIQREITLINQHSKTRFSFASICIFSFFFNFFFNFIHYLNIRQIKSDKVNMCLKSMWKILFKMQYFPVKIEMILWLNF